MKILALELSTARGSVAWKEEDLILEKAWPNDRKNSGSFFENVQAIRQEYGLPEVIIVGLGPGSYAGVRIAVSAAIGLQSASTARLIGAPSICAMESETADYDVIGDARRQSFFFARIQGRRLMNDPPLLSEADLQARLMTSEGRLVLSSDRLEQFPMVVTKFPSARQLALLATEKNYDFAVPPLQPMYLREPHITVPKKTDSRAIH